MSRKIGIALIIVLISIVVIPTIWVENKNKIEDKKRLEEASHLTTDKQHFYVTLLDDKIGIPNTKFSILEDEHASGDTEAFKLRSKKNKNINIAISIWTKKSTPWFQSISSIGFERNFDNNDEKIVNFIDLKEESTQVSDNSRMIAYKGDTGFNYIQIIYEKEGRLSKEDHTEFELFIKSIVRTKPD